MLFVEGNEEGLDQVVLRALLDNTLRIEAMGPSYSVRSAAQALATNHPRYYFLMDRDHYDDEFVEKSWRNFPDPDKSNLLVWRRREIENYFLDPSFLVKSQYCCTSEEELTATLEKVAQERVFLDVANFVISSVRGEQKRTWIEHFRSPADFSSREAAVEQLISHEAFVDRSRQVSEMLSRDKLVERFERSLVSMTGREKNLTYGTGQWVAMIRGKKVLPQLLNHPDRFQVEDASSRTLVGREMRKEVVKELAVKDVSSRPSDVAELQRLVRERVESR